MKKRENMKRQFILAFAVVVLLAVGLFLVVTSQNVLADEHEVKEFYKAFDKSQYNIRWDTSNRAVVIYNSAGKLIGVCKLKLGLAREKGTNDYLLLLKEEMTPQTFQVTERVEVEKWDALHLNKTITYKTVTSKKYGVSEYLSIRTILPRLSNYSPQNASQNDRSISVSLGMDLSGVSGGFSYEVKRNDLDLIVDSSTFTGALDVKYDYTPRLNIWASQPYLTRQSFQYAMADFTERPQQGRRDGDIGFTVVYNVSFGVSDDLDVKHLHWGEVYRKQQSETYNFTLPKK